MNLRPSDYIREEGWCQGCYARDRHNNPTSIWSPWATQWSLEGAIYKVFSPTITGDILRYVRDSLPPLIPGGVKYAETVARWNDHKTRTRKQVLKALKELGL